MEAFRWAASPSTATATCTVLPRCQVMARCGRSRRKAVVVASGQSSVRASARKNHGPLRGLRGKISETDLWTAVAATAGAILLLFAATRSQARRLAAAVWQVSDGPLRVHRPGGYLGRVAKLSGRSRTSSSRYGYEELSDSLLISVGYPISFRRWEGRGRLPVWNGRFWSVSTTLVPRFGLNSVVTPHLQSVITPVANETHQKAQVLS